MEKRVLFQGRVLPYLLLLPQLLITLVFFYWPALEAVEQSFFIEDAFGLAKHFVGLENYTALFSNPDYLSTFFTTLIFSGLVAFFALTLSLGLAVQADKAIKFATGYRTLLIWPYAVAPAVAGVLWLFMFQPSLGIISHVLHKVGIDWNPLLNANHAMLLVVMAATWKQISYNTLFFLAGLQAIPRSVIEAAAMDGAGPVRSFISITLPLLAPTSFYLLVVNIVYTFFDTFGIIDAVTGGGPSRATETLVYKAYHDGKMGGDLGGSAAQSVILMVLVIALTALQFRFLEKDRVMVEKRSFFAFLPHLVLGIGVLIIAFPVYIALIASTWDAGTIANGAMPLWPGPHFLENYKRVLVSGASRISGAPVYGMLVNSLIMALVIAGGKIIISLLSAFAVVYFRFPLRKTAFWLIFVTLMLPVEVRIYPTYKIVADLHMLDTYAGLTIPLIASATATLLFRQFFMSVPEELAEAAQIDGAGPMRFFISILIPLSATSIAAMFVIQFIYGWNQYLWPLLITTRSDMQTIVIGIKAMLASQDALTEWQLAMATAILAMLPPVLVVILMQRFFIKGLVEAEK